ncbi:aromatic amino acid ammonia-lyase, partial [Mycetohabitans sp. B3]|nr:aromatic amino acid ammonia-lyase [Mycetohabitans sp. B3]
MYKMLEITGEPIRVNDVARVAYDFNIHVCLGQKACKSIVESRKLLDNLILQGKVIYGVNTSMGGFVKYLIPEKYATQTQENLIAAVATNVGPYFDDAVVRATMLTRINSLARGVSAISLENI